MFRCLSRRTVGHGRITRPITMRMFSSEPSIKTDNDELVFPYAFMNTDPDLISTEMILIGRDEKCFKRHNKVLAEVSTFLDPVHSSNLHSHFKELYIYYLESLCLLDKDPKRLQQMCEPLFFRRLS